MFNSEQELFDHVALALLKQNERCAVGTTKDPSSLTHCLYRHNDLKCAVGHCIRDEDYESDMEGHPVKDVIDIFDIDYLLPYVNILIALQIVHDMDPIDQWRPCLQELADEFNLNFLVV